MLPPPPAADGLSASLDELKAVLGDIVADPARYRIRQELHAPLRDAWSAVQEAFDDAAQFLAEVPEHDLAAVGLAGSELELKLAGFGLALGDLQAARGFGMRGIVKALKKFLAWADVCLDSLAKLVNQADRIAEVKDAIGAAIPDEDEFPEA